MHEFNKKRSLWFCADCGKRFNNYQEMNDHIFECKTELERFLEEGEW